MWSDTPSDAQVRRLRGMIAAALPGPSGETGLHRVPIDVGAMPPAVVAEALIARLGLWLDSGDAGGHQIPLRALAILSGSQGRSRLRVGDKTTILPAAPLVALDAMLQHLEPSGTSRGTRLFGFLGYDLGASIEEMPALPGADQALPELWFAVCDVWLERDPDTSDNTGAWSLCVAAPWCEEPELLSLRTKLEEELHSFDGAVQDAAATGAAPLVSSRPDERGYRDAVERTVARIHAGDLFEANICRRLEAEWHGSAWPLYMRLRGHSPAEYGAYLANADWAVLSVSPELFLSVRDGMVQTRPIKGTRPRGQDDDQDQRLLQQLHDSDKDAAELAMIVDLARNDLGRVCVPGSVRVLEHRARMSLATVHHTYSIVAGEVLPATTAAGLLRATFPPGSITGAPKIQAMRVAYEEEPCRRGVAMGSIGWIDPNGDMEFSVAIRTATVAGGRVTYHAGCGIVADSLPEEEMEETVAKARPFLQALGHG